MRFIWQIWYLFYGERARKTKRRPEEVGTAWVSGLQDQAAAVVVPKNHGILPVGVVRDPV